MTRKPGRFLPADFESQQFGKWLQKNPVNEPRLQSSSDVDDLGGRWTTVRLPDWTGWELGVYLDRHGQLAGFRIAPCGEMSGGVIAPTPDGGLTVAQLRRVRLGELEQSARALARGLADLEVAYLASEYQFVDEDGNPTGDPIPIVEGGGSTGPATLAAIARAKATDVAIKRPGRRGTPDRVYASVAARYVNVLTERKPIEALAAEIGYSVSQTRHLVYMAREKGFLTARGQGRAGGELTKAATDLLNEGTNQ